ncbi:MAG: hypothetical protein NPIRA02_22560 [Nitrospirales bacterium]|nr:MAG: hypothetical protein NPIRA02_22560 [Nitrospirales bacterium]
MDQEIVSIETLLEFPERFHQKMVTVHGIVKQPEMHLDETELFFDFVFILEKDSVSLIVFGRHDRTQGGSSIAMGNYVEVTGIFWRDRVANNYHFENNLEAMTVTPYPSLIPDRTSFTQYQRNPMCLLQEGQDMINRSLCSFRRHRLIRERARKDLL